MCVHVVTIAQLIHLHMEMNKGCFPHLSHRHGIFKKKKKTFTSKRIKVNEVKKNLVTLEEISGRPAGPAQKPSLGSGPTVPVVQCPLLPWEPAFPEEPKVFHGQLL